MILYFTNIGVATLLARYCYWMVLVAHCCAMSFISNFAQITKRTATGSVPNVDIKADTKEYENNNNQLAIESVFEYLGMWL